VVDGNFKADHVKQKNEADDVPLTNGEGYDTAPGPYKEHLKEALKTYPKYKQVSNIRARFPTNIHRIF
jgi:hypothetical protein